MEGLEKLEDTVKQQLEENDRIEDIHQLLLALMEASVSPNFCSALFTPLICHAQRNKEINDCFTEYSVLLAELYQYVYIKEIATNHDIANDSLKLIKNVIHVFRCEDMIDGDDNFNLETANLEEIMLLLCIAMGALHRIWTVNANNNEYAFYASDLWSTLGDVVYCCLFESCLASAYILKYTCGMCFQLLISKKLNIKDVQVEDLLANMLLVLEEDGFDLDTLNLLAETISFTVTSFQDLTIFNFSPFVSGANSIAHSIITFRQFNISKIKALTNVTCLLLANYINTPWIEDILAICEEVSGYEESVEMLELKILQKKAEFLIKGVKASITTVTSTPAASLITETDLMDTDDVSLRSGSQPFEGTSVVKFDSINATIASFLPPLMHRLLALCSGEKQECDLLLAKIKIICAYAYNGDMVSISQPYIKQLAEFVAKQLAVDPAMAESVIYALDYEIPQFLLKYLEFCLPYAIIHTDNDDAVGAIANALGYQIPQLCKFGAHHIIVSILMEKDPKDRDYGRKRLLNCLKTRTYTIQAMANDNKNKICSLLIMNMGTPSLKQQAVYALEELKDLVGMRMTLSKFVSWFFIAILNKITRYISEKRMNSKEIHDPQALEALKEVMLLLGPETNEHAFHLTKVFGTVGELDDMQLQALSLWETFTSVLDNKAVVFHLNSIVRRIVTMLPVTLPSIRPSVAHTVYTLLTSRAHLVSNYYDILPILADFPELRQVKDYVENANRSVDDKETLAVHDYQNITQNFLSTDESQVLSSLQKFELLLDANFSHINYNEVYSHLLKLIRKYSSHKEIPYIASVCLGRLGAMDPGSIKVDIQDSNVITVNYFRKQSETREFVSDLIVNHIIPVYNATNDEIVHQYIHYSIQTLLHCASFRPVDTMKSSETYKEAYRSWCSFPASIREFLAPFLQSSYEISWPDISTPSPIFPTAEGFSDWVQKFYCQLVNATQASAKNVFSACIPIVQSNILDVTLHLIPYLVLTVVITASGDVVHNIINEMVLILHTNAEAGDDSERGKMNYQALQVVVSVAEMCRKWMNRIAPDELEKKSALDRVSLFLQHIPQKQMSLAALNSGAYPQALMLLETAIKQDPNTKLKDAQTLNYLRVVFDKLEEANNVKALMKQFREMFVNDSENIKLECEGKWRMAEGFYKGAIEKNPNDLSAYIGYTDCLKKTDSYDKILFLTEGISEALQSRQLNSIRVDAAWRVKKWDALNKAVALPIQDNFQTAIGKIISGMRNRHNLDAACDIEHARKGLIERLTTKTDESYRKSYPVIYGLQLLNELETSQKVWESSISRRDMFEAVSNKWDSNYKNLIPKYEYRHNLLELRKAAYFDIRPKDGVINNPADIWVQLAKSYRKTGKMEAAWDAIVTAECIGPTYFDQKSYYLEKAKWHWRSGNFKTAVDLIMSKNPEHVYRANDALLLVKYCIERPRVAEGLESPDGTSLMRSFFSASFKTTDKLEKAYNLTAAYYHKLANAEHKLIDEKTVINHFKKTEYVIRACGKALSYGSKYYYSCMSRMLNSWFEIVGFEKEMMAHPQETVREAFENIMKDVHILVNKLIDNIPVYQFGLFLTRIISHLTTENAETAKCLSKIIINLFTRYPRNFVWLLLGAQESEAPFLSARINHILDLAKEAHSHTLIPVIIEQAYHFADALYSLASAKIDKGTLLDFNLSDTDRFPDPILNQFRVLVSLKDLELCVPTEASLQPQLPEIIDRKRDHRAFPNYLPTIQNVGDKVVVMRSLQQPKRIFLMGSDGVRYNFLVKKDDDLRKDARTMEFNYAINSFLKRNPESRDSNLYIRTYAVIPLGHKWGLIQWINNLQALKSTVNDLWVASGLRGVSVIGLNFSNLTKLVLDNQKQQIFEEKILPNCPPVFHKWFLSKFPEPNQWLSSRTRYIKSLAVMSIVGYFLGLGDRHAENILFDSKSGDCVHVDLNMLFDTGLNLTVPEVVPFRLTRNLIDAMGVLGYHGTFSDACYTTFKVMLENKDALLGVFQTLMNEWTLDSSGQVPSRTILRPPKKYNLESLKRMTQKFDFPREKSVVEVVDGLIETASSNKNLCMMFAGWAPFV